MTAKTGFTHESTYNESKEWYTPKYIFDNLWEDVEKTIPFQFDLDPCSPGADVVPWIPATNHITKDGLYAHWEGRIWLNPPYGSDTPKWLYHLCEVHRCGSATGIALVFGRTDTKWFHDYAPDADAICFLKGRVKFVAASNAVEYAKGNFKPKGGCGSASMLMAYGKDEAAALRRSGLGLVLA